MILLLSEKLTTIDHPIFQQSIRYIQAQLGNTRLEPLEQEVLERLIHTSGDFSIQNLLKFSPDACQKGILALKNGAPIITDTTMAQVGIGTMARKTLQPSLHCALDWAPSEKELTDIPRTVSGMLAACNDLSKKWVGHQSPIVVIGSAPKALIALIELISAGKFVPSLVIGMPVGFISVLESKRLLSNTLVPQIRLEGNRGGAALAAASVNALLRAAIN
ncbi:MULTISPECIES: precorrin-8X methylmutase [Prochlorococcus]|uniref:precorrin-8X methylmutase n=1 Tax=Prochlorococcus TaxID=1218 RepID=UPI0005339CA9|nr:MULTISPECIES: precorrin-8X methylmutase [Prochlorococcus]KGG13674.1 Cobalt-precorrin-8x methylmutase [Prochlorococcus sp. MIT 0601]